MQFERRTEVNHIDVSARVDSEKAKHPASGLPTKLARERRFVIENTCLRTLFVKLRSEGYRAGYRDQTGIATGCLVE